MRPRSVPMLVLASMLVALAVACGGPTVQSQPTQTDGLAVGGAAPEFTLPSADGHSISLADFRGHKPVLLYFSMGPG